MEFKRLFVWTRMRYRRRELLYFVIQEMYGKFVYP